MIDDEDLNRALYTAQLKAQLLLDRRDDRWARFGGLRHTWDLVLAA